MKIIILHGEDLVKIGNRLQMFVASARKRGWDIYKVSDKSQNVREVISSNGLFSSDKLIVVEDPFLIDTKTLKWLKENGENFSGTLVVVNKGYLSKTFLKSLPKIEKEEEYKLRKLIWNLLDSFFPGNARNELLLLNEVAKSEPIEFVFSLLGKLIRDLYWVRVDPKTLPYPEWRGVKLARQSSKFQDNLLKTLIEDFSKIDFENKTSSGDLKSSLDFLIVSRLQ